MRSRAPASDPGPEGGAWPRGRGPRPIPRGPPHPGGLGSVRPAGGGRESRAPREARRRRRREPGSVCGGAGCGPAGRAPPQARAPPATSAGGARRELGHCGRRGRARRGVRGKCGGGARGRREVGVPAGAGPVRPAAGSAPAARRSGSHGLSPAAPSTGPHRGGRGARGRRRGPFKGTARRPRARTRRPGARRPAGRWAPREGPGRGGGARAGRSRGGSSAPPPHARSANARPATPRRALSRDGTWEGPGRQPALSPALRTQSPRAWGAPSPRRPHLQRSASGMRRQVGARAGAGARP